MLEHAIALAERGFQVFPIYGFADGKCECGAPGCHDAAKHPIPSEGFYAATRDLEEVRAWWEAFPTANVGIRTGDGVVAVDVDPRNKGEGTLEELEAQHGEFPDTFTVRTGSGGLHAFFKVDGPRKWRKGIGKGVDIKGDGGYVVGAGSKHASGGTYEVIVEAPMAPAPSWLLDLAIAGPAPAPSTPTTPTPSPGPIDLGAMRERLAEARRSKAHGNERAKEQAEILGRILEGKALAEAGGRDTTILRAAGLVAYWLPAATPWEVALEILRPSISAMDTQPEGFAHWVEVARVKYERQAASRIEADAKRAADDARLREIARSIAGRPIATAAAEIVESGGKWEDLLIVNRDGIRPCEHNAQVILACAPELRGTIRFNVVKKKIEITDGPFAGLDPEVLGGAAAAWLQHQYEFFGGAQMVTSALVRVARANPHDPIAEYLNELAWDGTPRLDKFLETYFGANEEDTRYIRAVSRRFLIGLVARALDPGCQLDTVLILEGEQGEGKTRGLEALVGPEYFLDTSLALGEKDTMQAIASIWLAELGELASIRSAEMRKNKQFVTVRIDKYRPPYGATTVDSPRRCVFCGTTNDKHYLQDRTGNRRYWPFRVGRIDLAGIKRDRDQLFAEAVIAYRVAVVDSTVERWWFDKVLDAELIALAAKVTGERLDGSTYEEAIDRWWYGEAPARRPKQMSVIDVAEMALHVTVDRIDHRVRSEIGAAMWALGFRQKQMMHDGARTRVYVPTLEMLEAPVRTSAARAANLALVNALKPKGKDGT